MPVVVKELVPELDADTMHSVSMGQTYQHHGWGILPCLAYRRDEGDRNRIASVDPIA